MGNSALRCCMPPRPGRLNAEDGEDSQGRLACNRVEVAASEIFSIPGLATAYHTSVVVNGEEFFFSDSGIFNDRVLTSHEGNPSERYQVGWSTKTGSQLLRALSPHFLPGTYDLIRKNCNSFSDCALHYLLGKRLPSKYSALERMGQRASPSLLQKFTEGSYMPNDAAKDFSAAEVIKALDALGEEPPEAGGSMPSKSALARGARVTVIGLKKETSLNGTGAQIIRFNAVNGRWEARVNADGSVKAFRAENLRPVSRYLHDLSRYEVLIDGVAKAVKGENLQLADEVE